jgi:S-adenosyl-L-methionine hydrolase (adenosine-forming)
MTAVITFLSDYGSADEFVGVCHGVIAERCPHARIIDLTHGIPRHDIRAGALALRAALPYTPAGVHLAVIDPGVGGSRRAVALATREGNRLLVGPDNGVLAPAAAVFGGAGEAIDISDSPARLPSPSTTFDGRDLFAPVAAALADGAALRTLGSPIATDSLAELALPEAQIDRDTLVAHVLSVDAYGNLSLDAPPELASRAGITNGTQLDVETAAGRLRARHGTAFEQVAPGELLTFNDSRGALALAVYRGSAAQQLGLGPDDEVRLRAR